MVQFQRVENLQYVFGAEPVLFFLVGFAATTFLQLIGPLPYHVLWRRSVWHHRQLYGRVLRCDGNFWLRLLESLGIEHRDTSSVQCARRDLLQMNCLSSEDLKEERNYSLTYKPTLNLDACPV